VTEVLRSTAAKKRVVRTAPPRSVPRSWVIMKRAIDILVSLLVLIVTSPVLLAAVIGITIVSGGSPIFTQERIGRDGRCFRMFKLRTMVRGAHLLHAEMQAYNEVEGPVFKMRDDPRLHLLGAFLRRTSIDELPNFLNVLRGEMAAVGPRPPLPSEVADYDEYALRRLSVKPGVTCLWQISGRSEISFDQWMALDNAYIDSWSPALDVLIIARTIPAVLRGIGAH
jgi:lipopolysaccharide/colanic/teichoic acid biosynthesis glycosyltransferase